MYFILTVKFIEDFQLMLDDCIDEIDLFDL